MILSSWYPQISGVNIVKRLADAGGPVGCMLAIHPSVKKAAQQDFRE